MTNVSFHSSSQTVFIHSNTFVRMDVKNQIAGGKGTEVTLIISIMNNNNLNSIKT